MKDESKQLEPQKQRDPREELLDMALGHDHGGCSSIARAQILIRSIADQIYVLTSIGNEPLQGYIANGFAYALLEADKDLAQAMEWMKRGPAHWPHAEVKGGA